MMKKFRYIVDDSVYDEDMIDIIAADKMPDTDIIEATKGLYSTMELFEMLPKKIQTKIIKEAISIFKQTMFIEEPDKNEEE